MSYCSDAIAMKAWTMGRMSSGVRRSDTASSEGAIPAKTSSKKKSTSARTSDQRAMSLRTLGPSRSMPRKRSA